MNGEPISQRAQSFYDHFSGTLVGDFWHGNPRAMAAIRHAVAWISRSAKRVLDIGCGIGWSTREIARHRPEAEILGLDLSPRLIEVARRLNDLPNVRFEVKDFTSGPAELEGNFDAIVLLDVYEHFPTATRAVVHAALARLLNDSGIVILAFPTPAHQAFLRTRCPEGLQPVDEDVTRDDIGRLAEDVGGRVACFREVSIWRSNDYAHAAIVRREQAQAAPEASRSEAVKLEPDRDRQGRVRSCLGVRVLGRSLVVPDREGPVLCVACTHLDTLTETFIQDQIVRLRMPTRALHGAPPHFDDEGRDVLESSLAQRAVARFRRCFGKADWDRFNSEAVARFLRRNNVAAMLAQYGMNGALVMDACAVTRVPLVVHFHGYDAYKTDVLDRYGETYRRMFQQAAAIVAVSQHMQRQLVALGASPDKVHYIPYGADPTIFDGARPAQAPPHLLAVGRFVEKKSPHLTLLAFARALRACPDARLTMIGDGPLLGPCCQLARVLGIDEAVEFAGARSRIYVRDAMQRCRAFVQHSVRALNGDCEGTPVAVLEAQAAGLPVVATAHAGIPDVVLDGQTGLLVPEEDVDAMAAAMIEMATEPERAGQLGGAGRQRVLERFASDQAIGKLAAVISKACGNRIPRVDL